MARQKRVLVLGATGAMGRYIVPELANLDYNVVGVAFDDGQFNHPAVSYVKGNAKDPAILKPLLEQRFDAIVDFLVHPTAELANTLPLMLNSTDQYVYVSSGRVFANEENPVRETSPRLIDVSTDTHLVNSDDYCIYKARGENIIRALGTQKNWTIVRPMTTFSFMRYQLVTLEAPNNVGRAMQGKKVVVPEQARNVSASLNWGGDVAKMIALLLFNDKAYGEDFNVNSAESHTWQEIADYYKDICNLQAVWVDKEDYLSIITPDPFNLAPRWQLEYARLFERVCANDKVLAATGLKQADLMPLYDGLKLEVQRCPKDTAWKVNTRMDDYLAAHGY